MSDAPRPFVSIVVANWQGQAWIARCLSSLQLSARAARVPFEVIVVDDASDDGSPEEVERGFHSVRLIRNDSNIGYGATTMRGVRAARGPVVLLCNNDLLATESFVGNLLRWFRAPQSTLADGSVVRRDRLFGVSARTVAWYDGKPNQLRMVAQWRGGRITPAWSDPPSAERALFVQAGAAAYRRKALLEIGGLAEDFAPGYWEDYDLSWRAAAAGMTSLYDPESIALHVGGGSMTKRYGADAVERLKARNHLLFEWRNLTDRRMLAEHALRLGLGIGREWFSGRPARLTRAVLDAGRRIGPVLRHRVTRETAAVGDRTLLAMGRGAKPSY